MILLPWKSKAFPSLQTNPSTHGEYRMANLVANFRGKHRRSPDASECKTCHEGYESSTGMRRCQRSRKAKKTKTARFVHTTHYSTNRHHTHPRPISASYAERQRPLQFQRGGNKPGTCLLPYLSTKGSPTTRPACKCAFIMACVSSPVKNLSSWLTCSIFQLYRLVHRSKVQET